MSSIRGGRYFAKFTERDKLVEAVVKRKGQQRGRSKELIELRNKKLCYRYYYYSRLLKYDYMQVVQVLKHEFDLTESTLGQIFEDMTEELTRVRNEAPTRRVLRGKYPYLRWDEKPIKTLLEK